MLILNVAFYVKRLHFPIKHHLVYYPEARIPNPKGLENDLSRGYEELEVKVLITPKG